MKVVMVGGPYDGKDYNVPEGALCINFQSPYSRPALQYDQPELIDEIPEIITLPIKRTKYGYRVFWRAKS